MLSSAKTEPEMTEVLVTGVRDRLEQAGVLKDVIEKTEVIGANLIAAKYAPNLAEALEDSAGARVSNECSMCAVKRVMLNGLRGEHTTILVDGLPVHTMLSGYYAVDAIATTGVDRIEVARGAGASLIAPEAVGGTINVITREAYETNLEVDLSREVDREGYQASLLGTLVSADGRGRSTLVLQQDYHDQLDDDDNGVSEAPEQDNRSLILRHSQDFSAADNLVVRVGIVDATIFGGPLLGEQVSGIGDVLAGADTPESEQLFVDDDVRNRYIGQPWETTEWIHTERREASAAWLHEFSGDFNSTLSYSYARHEQDSFYEGFDYAAIDEMSYVDLRSNWRVHPDHVLTFGIDRRDERMRSDSAAGEASPDYITDSFDYEVTGLYLKDTWQVSDRLEAALALRYDLVRADFVAPEKPGTEIDDAIFAPRMDLRYRHSERWTSRLSAGRGYRAPLAFFESDHGILDSGDGFAIDINALEDSLSGNYSLSFEDDRLTTTLSLAHTRVDRLASIDETETGVPLLTQIDGSAEVTAADVVVGFALTDHLTVNAIAERLLYEDAFAATYGVAPVDERYNLALDYERGRWQVYTSATLTGSRDLGDYGYEGFNVRGDPDSAKPLQAPAYWFVDLNVGYQFSDRVRLYAGANNLFDYTQVTEEETPLFFDADGAYDVAYIYGPLRGREIYAGLRVSLR
jgi:outer membrane receptor for ferrienterochelin and colicin